MMIAKPLNVLILEDNPSDAELLLIELRKAGYQPTWQIVDTEKGYLHYLKPTLDMILSDYSLPQFSGLQALILKNESGFDIPFIIVSGAIGEELGVECMREGADDYLMKDRLGRLGIAIDNALKNKVLRGEKQQVQQEIEMLLALSRKASTETSLNDLLFFIANQVVEVISPVEAASIFLYDEERKVVSVRGWAGFNDREIKGLEFPVEERQVGRIFRTKIPEIIKNVSENPDFELIDKPGIRETKSQMAVPLIYKECVVGIMFADNLTRTDAFSQQNLDFLESIGNQLAGVIMNARLLEDVRQSEVQYRSVVENSPVLIEKFLPDGTITFVNQEYCRFFGKKADELIGMNIRFSIPEEERESVMSKIASLSKESPVQTFENNKIRHNGEVRWVRWVNHALFDNEGQKTSIQSLGEDITESKQAKEKEQRHLHNIAYLSKTAMQFVDFPPQEDIYRFISEKLKELSGESIVVVNSIDQAKGILTTRAVAGMGKYTKDIMKLVGRNPKGIEYDANDEGLAYLADGKLHDYKEGLYGLFLGTVPKPACRAIEKLYRLNKIYTIGFVQNERLFGNAVIILPKGIELESAETIKLFIEQASIAIQRMQAEQALNQEKEKAQKYLDIAEVMIMALNIEGEITLVNKKGASILGYGVEELIGSNWFNTCVPAASRKQTKKLFDDFMAGGVALGDHFNQTVITKSGEERIIDWHSIPLWEWEADVKHRTGSLSSGEDITEQKLTNEKLRQSEVQYRSVVENSPVFIEKFLPDGTITFVNQEYCRFFGKKADELIGMNIRFSIPEEERESVMSKIASLSKESPVQTFENNKIRHNGEVRWVRWVNHALFDNEGQKTSIQSLGEDITESKQAKEKEQRHLHNIAYLSKTAMQFVDFPPQEDIYRFISEKLKELSGESIVVVNSIDQAKGLLITRAVAGMGKYTQDIIKLVGRNPEGMKYDVNDEGLAYLADGKLHDYKEGLYGLFLGTVPKPACRAIEKLYRLNKIYTIGFVQNERLFGNATIFLPKGIELESAEIIKLFIEQASIAIQRMQAEQALNQEKEKAQKYLDIAEVMIMALNIEGEITLMNQKGAEILGYKSEELIGKNWFDTCVPESDRKQRKKSSNDFMAGGAGQGKHFENTVLTKSGKERIIGWHSIPLWEWEADVKHRTGSLSSGEDITNRMRVQQLLNTLNDAAVAMGTSQTQEEIFNAVSKELDKLGFTAVLFPIDDTRSKLSTRFLGIESKTLIALEKMLGFQTKDYWLPIDSIDVFSQVIREKKTLIFDNTLELLKQILSKQFKKAATLIPQSLKTTISICAPLEIGDTVIGLFAVGSKNLTQADIPAVTAFADQLSSAWNKIGLLQNLRTTVEGTIHTIAATVEARDPYTAGHQTRVADLAASIAREMKLNSEQIIGVRMAGIVHDLGKIQVPAEILSKPGQLSELEFSLIKTHPQVGYNLLKEIEFPWPIAQMVLQHHEKIDGSGYPQGLKGEEILLEARILAVSDVVEAMSSHRPYRPALGIEKALKQIKKDKGTLLDPDVVDACLKIFKEGYKLLEN